MIEMCYFYSVTDFPEFNPKCHFGRRAGLGCHSRRDDCPYYIDSDTAKEKIEQELDRVLQSENSRQQHPNII